MATYDWSTFNQVTVVSSQLLVPQTVSLGQVFAGVAMPTDDDYSIAITLTGVSLDAGAGPFAITTSAPVGTDRVDVGVGVGAGFAVGDVVVLRNPNGETMITEVESSHSGTDRIPLTEKTKISLPVTTATIERAPRIEVTSTEGVGSGAGGTATRTEVLWLADLDTFNGRLVNRLRIDRGTTITLTTFDFTATTIAVYDFVDLTNIHRSDRRTPRTLHGSTVAPTAVATAFTAAVLSGASGHKPTSKGFLGATIDRYAEQHPPVRLQIDVTAGTDFTGGVTIEGFRTIWSPVRDAVAIGAGSVRISPECYSQFVVGDVVTLYDLTTDTTETQTIASKTAPDVLNFVGVTANAYALDDIVGINQTETVSVAAGIGTYYTADAWVYPLTHNTAGGTENFSYEVSQTVQGWCGALHTADNRLGGGIATTGTRQCTPIVQTAIGRINVGDGVTPTVVGQLSGVVSLPRHQDNFLQLAASDSLLWFGSKNKFGAVVAGVYVLRGSEAGSTDLWQIPGAASNGIVILGVLFQLRKILAGTDAGRADVLDPAFWRFFNATTYCRNLFRQSSTDVRGRQLISAIDNANDTVLGGAGASYQVNAPTGVNDFALIQDATAYARGVSIIPATGFPGQPIRVNGFNRDAAHAGGGLSKRVSLFAQNIEYIGRCVNSYFTELEMRGAVGVTIDLESAITARICVVDENGDPVEGALVKVVDATGVLVVDEVSDVFGEIPEQELVTHQYRKNNAGGSSIWRVGDSPPIGVVLTIFAPFEILVLPQIGVQEGYAPYHAFVDAVEFDPASSFIQRAVLDAARAGADEGPF